MSRTALIVLTIALLFAFAGCKEETRADGTDARKLAELLAGAGGFQCKEVDAFIPKGLTVEGTTCPENKAVVNGWSLACVAQGQCSAPARLAEVNAAAEAVCASWCKAKNCSYKYDARDNCASHSCLASDSCRQNCNVPLRDSCYLNQAAIYNCTCQIKVEG